MFRYIGKHKYRVRQPIGRVPGEEAIGHWFQDYHGNRNMFIRPIEAGKYHLVITVCGAETTNVETTWSGMRSYLINHLQFQLTDNYLRVIK